MTINYNLSLDYQLQAGWLEPFVHGLQQGIAIARSCTACNKISFPPVRVCECSHTHGNWVNLSGKAHIQYRCTGTEGNFALVQFEGADTQTVVRLEDMTENDLAGQLMSPKAGHSTDQPALVLTSHHQGNDS